MFNVLMPLKLLPRGGGVAPHPMLQQVTLLRLLSLYLRHSPPLVWAALRVALHRILLGVRQVEVGSCGGSARSCTPLVRSESVAM